MATRCNIGIYNKEKRELKLTYCHFDGYLKGVGYTLLENYKDEEKINELIDKGYIRALNDTVETTDYFEDCFEEITVDITNDSDKWIKDNLWDGDLDYIYLWKDSKWKYFKVVFDDRFHRSHIEDLGEIKKEE